MSLKFSICKVELFLLFFPHKALAEVIAVQNIFGSKIIRGLSLLNFFFQIPVVLLWLSFFLCIKIYTQVASEEKRCSIFNDINIFICHLNL